MKTTKLRLYEETPENYTGIIVRHHGDTHWYLNGKLHNPHGPALIGPPGPFGYVQYHLDGEELSHEKWKKERGKYMTTVAKLLLNKRVDK